MIMLTIVATADDMFEVYGIVEDSDDNLDNPVVECDSVDNRDNN